MQSDLRALAAADVDAAVAYYLNEADRKTAHEFVDALETAINHLRRHPLTGSLRFAFELEIPDLRSWPVKKFPYLVFYVPADDHIDIWRVLHARRDIPAHLNPDPPE